MKLRKLLLIPLLFAASLSVRAQVQPVNATLTAASTGVCLPTNCLPYTVPSGVGSATFQIGGNTTFSGTIQFEVVLFDGSYYSLNGTPSNSTTAVTSATGPGSWQVNIAGYSTVRMRVTTLASGSVAAAINPSTASARAGGGGGAGGGVTSFSGDGSLITNSGSTGAVTATVASLSGTGSVCMTTNCSMTTPNLGTPSAVNLSNGTALPLSALANQGTTVTVLHGNAAGNPTFAVTTPSDAVGNTSGSGNFCLVTSCAMTTPNLGTPSAVTLTNGTGYLLSALASATSAPTLANGNNPQTWNWAQTTNNQAGMTFGETSAATNGTVTSFIPNQSNVTVSTASGSTASPLKIVQGSVTGTTAFPITTFQSTQNNASLAGEGVIIKVTETANAVNSHLFQVLGGASGNVPALQIFGANTGPGYVYNFGNTYSLLNGGGGKLSIENAGETQFQAVQAGGFQASDGFGSGAMFGSFMYVKPEPCETNFAATSVNTGSATTTTGLSCITANSMVIDVVYRITTTITTAANFTVGISGTTSKFCTTQSTMTAGTTGHCVLQVNAGTAMNTAAAQVVVTFNATPGAGALRLIAYNLELTAPTS